VTNTSAHITRTRRARFVLSLMKMGCSCTHATLSHPPFSTVFPVRRSPSRLGGSALPCFFTSCRAFLLALQTPEHLFGATRNGALRPQSTHRDSRTQLPAARVFILCRHPFLSKRIEVFRTC
jgi:hypothetical protein